MNTYPDLVKLGSSVIYNKANVKYVQKNVTSSNTSFLKNIGQNELEKHKFATF